MKSPKRIQSKIRNCPFCRIAMVASRTEKASAGFDQFQCLQCGTIIRFDDGRDIDNGGEHDA